MTIYIYTNRQLPASTQGSEEGLVSEGLMCDGGGLRSVNKTLAWILKKNSESNPQEPRTDVSSLELFSE